MPITEEQLNAIKAANHAKSVAWEAATFLPGDEVITHGFGAWRMEDGKWRCSHDLVYETLSRLGRDRLKRTSFDPKTSAFLKVDANTFVMCGELPPAAERNQWIPGRQPQPQIQAQPQPQPQPQKPTLEDRIAAIEAMLARLEKIEGRSFMSGLTLA